MIAPSKLGHLIAQEWHSDDGLIGKLRQFGLVKTDAADADLRATFQKARDEDIALGESPYNSPEERVRVFLDPLLTEKGRKWAVPLDSLKLPDFEAPSRPRRPWWKWWA